MLAQATKKNLGDTCPCIHKTTIPETKILHLGHIMNTGKMLRDYPVDSVEHIKHNHNLARNSQTSHLVTL